MNRTSTSMYPHVRIQKSFLLFLLLFIAQAAQAQWPVDPSVNVGVSSFASKQSYPYAVRDNANGMIVAWQDNRHTGNHNYDIYVQRFLADGTKLWGDGIRVSTGTENKTVSYMNYMIADNSGGVIIVWQEFVNIRAQRLNASGTKLWGADGVLVVAGGAVPAVCTDGGGGAIICWSGNMGDVFVNRVNGSGVLQWGTSGTNLCNATGVQRDINICSDNNGGAFVIWEDSRNGTEQIYGQRVNSTGVAQWTANGIAVAGTSRQLSASIINAGASGAIIGWHDERNGQTNWDIYAQRLDLAGTRHWGPSGMAVCDHASSQDVEFTMTSDENGGAIFAWSDYRLGKSRVFGQRLASSGLAQWTASGLQMDNANGSQGSVHVISDRNGGAIFVYGEYRDSDNRGIFGQRFNSAGTNLWSASGAQIAVAGDYNQFVPVAVSSGLLGKAIVAWQDDRNSARSGVYAMGIMCEAPPGDAFTIDGNDLFCRNGSATFSVEPVTGATHYKWIIPDGAGWSGYSWTNEITVTGRNPATLKVEPRNACGRGAQASRAIDIVQLPGSASIIGPETVCAGQTYTYSSSASDYTLTWTLPLGWTGSSTTNSIQVVAGTTSGNVSLVRSNACFTGEQRNLAITAITVPVIPDEIMGESTLTAGTTGNIYSVNPVPTASSYQWTVPQGWGGISSNAQILVEPFYPSADISVKAINMCGTGIARIKTINVNRVPQQITFSALPEEVNLNDGVLPLMATATSESLVTFSSSDEEVAVVNGSDLMLLEDGEVTVTAHQEGTSVYEPAEDVSQTLNVFVITGTEPGKKIQLTIAPNPGTGLYRIYTSERISVKDIYLTDITGRSCAFASEAEMPGTLLLDIHSLPAGMYFLKVQGTTAAMKIVKQ